MRYTKEYLINFIKHSNIAYTLLNDKDLLKLAYFELDALVELIGVDNIYNDTTITEIAYILDFSNLLEYKTLPYCILLERLAL